MGGPLGLGVALRKESVDRNEDRKKIEAWHLVALRKESVDRNSHLTPTQRTQIESLSARRAWIEIGPQPGGRGAEPRGRSPQGERG